MATNKPEVFRFHCHGQSAPAYSCNKPADNSGEYVRLAEHEALQAECEKLRALLLQSAPIIHAHAGASHMLEGFKPKRNKWDELAEEIDAAMRSDKPC